MRVELVSKRGVLAASNLTQARAALREHTWESRTAQIVASTNAPRRGRASASSASNPTDICVQTLGEHTSGAIVALAVSEKPTCCLI